MMAARYLIRMFTDCDRPDSPTISMIRSYRGTPMDLSTVLELAGDLRASYRPNGSILLYDKKKTTRQILSDPNGQLAIGIIEVMDSYE